MAESQRTSGHASSNPYGMAFSSCHSPCSEACSRWGIKARRFSSLMLFVTGQHEVAPLPECPAAVADQAYDLLRKEKTDEKNKEKEKRGQRHLNVNLAWALPISTQRGGGLSAPGVLRMRRPTTSSMTDQGQCGMK